MRYLPILLLLVGCTPKPPEITTMGAEKIPAGEVRRFEMPDGHHYWFYFQHALAHAGDCPACNKKAEVELP